jgi:hypothetical protein
MTMTQQALESKDRLRLPGESNPDFSRVVHEYLSNFAYYKIKKDYAQKEQLYQWCAEYMGEKYKDWFIHEGGKYDKWWSINILSPKHCTLFSLRWSDIIIEFVDRRKE